MKKISLILFLCIIAFSILRAEDKSVIKLIPVYEKTFQDTIVDVIFDTATVNIEKAKAMGWKEEAFNEGERAKGEATISYPKVVMVSRGRELGWYAPERRNSYYLKEIRFYNKKGKLLNTLEIGTKGDEWVHISANHKYVLISKIPAEYNSEYSGGILYNNEGKRICEINGPTPIAVSDEGYMIAAYLDWQVPPELGGSFYIYNPSGKLIKTIKNPDKEKTAPLFAKYSKDGEYAVLVFKATTFPPTVICLIKKTGKILWKKEFPEFRFSARDKEINLQIDKGSLLLLDKYDRKTGKRGKPFVSFIDWQGNLEWAIGLERRGSIILEVLENEEKACVVSEIGYIWCVGLSNGELLWKSKLPWAPGPGERWSWELPRLKELIIRDKTIYTIAKQGTDGHNATLYIFNSENGGLLKKVEYPLEKITFAKCKEGIGLINITKRKMYIFKKVQK